MQCLFLDSRNQQCPRTALEGIEFCDDHLPAVEDGEPPSNIPLIYRLTRRVLAALLLGMFLMQLYVGLRLLYGW
jgi:hypothetical protein